MPNYPDKKFPAFGLKVEPDVELLKDPEALKKIVAKYGFMLMKSAGILAFPKGDYQYGELGGVFDITPSVRANSSVPHSDMLLGDTHCDLFVCTKAEESSKRSFGVCGMETGFKAARDNFALLKDVPDLKDAGEGKNARENKCVNAVENYLERLAQAERVLALDEEILSLHHQSFMERIRSLVNRLEDLGAEETASNMIKKTVESLGKWKYEHVWEKGDVMLVGGDILHYRAAGTDEEAIVKFVTI